MSQTKVETKQEQNTVDKIDYLWTEKDQPHRWRRREILKKYPQIRDLYGFDPMTKYNVIAMVLGQVIACYLMRDASWKVILLMAYCFGGVINHSLTLAIHEITHGLAFESFEHNQWFAMFANVPLGIPYAIQFRKYHFDHHQYQGIPGKDVDIPTYLEGRNFYTIIKKIIWVFFFPVHYTLRPVFINPKKPTIWEFYNISLVVIYDLFIFWLGGWKALAYTLIGTYLGIGLHPVSGHFIAEHYVFHEKQETYSYYGPFNYFTYNVGYHNEHHDFPRIPASRLPKVREIAAEFYDPLPHHSSWTKVLCDFIFKPLHPCSRVARTTTFGDKKEN